MITIVSNKKAPLEWPRTVQAGGPLWGWAPCQYPGCMYNLSGIQTSQHFVTGSAQRRTEIIDWTPRGISSFDINSEFVDHQ